MQTAIQWIFRALAIVAALLATIQPVLGSFAFFRLRKAVVYETTHLVVGGFIYTIALVLVLFTQLRRRWLLLGSALPCTVSPTSSCGSA